MPRASLNPVTKIVNYFRSADLVTADTVLGLCKDTVAERHQRSELARKAAKVAQRKATAKPRTKAKAAPAAAAAD